MIASFYYIFYSILFYYTVFSIVHYIFYILLQLFYYMSRLHGMSVFFKFDILLFALI